MEIDCFHTGDSLKKTTGASSFECSSGLCQVAESLQSSVHAFHLTKDHSLTLHIVKSGFDQSYFPLEKKEMLGKAVSCAKVFSQSPIV